MRPRETWEGSRGPLPLPDQGEALHQCAQLDGHYPLFQRSRKTLSRSSRVESLACTRRGT